MAWQQVQNRRRGGKGKGGNTAAFKPEVEKFAREIRAALMAKPYAGNGNGHVGKPEWECSTCGTHNFMTRSVCRQCGPQKATMANPGTAGRLVAAGAPDAALKSHLPPGSVWADPAISAKPAARAAALEKARAAASSAGAPADALAAMDRELQSMKSQAANARPLGARLDSAKAKLLKAESREHAAQNQLEKAVKQLEETREQRKVAEAALLELRSEIPSESSQLPAELVKRTKLLLDRLESGSLAVSAEMPAELVAAMTAVHEVVNTLDPPSASTLDGPLEPAAEAGAGEPGGVQSMPGRAAEDDAVMSESEAIDKLDEIDESNDDALLEIARRLKRARRM